MKTNNFKFKAVNVKTQSTAESTNRTSNQLEILPGDNSCNENITPSEKNPIEESQVKENPSKDPPPTDPEPGTSKIRSRSLSLSRIPVEKMESPRNLVRRMKEMPKEKGTLLHLKSTLKINEESLKIIWDILIKFDQ